LARTLPKRLKYDHVAFLVTYIKFGIILIDKRGHGVLILMDEFSLARMINGVRTYTY